LIVPPTSGLNALETPLPGPLARADIGLARWPVGPLGRWAGRTTSEMHLILFDAYHNLTNRTGPFITELGQPAADSREPAQGSLKIVVTFRTTNRGRGSRLKGSNHDFS
jgi:hypothetical protein